MLSFLLVAASCLLFAQASSETPSPSEIVNETVKVEMIPLFIPPLGWKCALPKNLSQYVLVGFVGEGTTQFHPSINLAIEEVDLSQKEYVKAVKEIHVSDPHTTWRNLGKFSMKAGVGNLTEITSTSAWGTVKMLQAILVKDNKAYILTAAFLKQDYPQFQKEILESLHSLSLHPNLAKALPTEEQQMKFAQFLEGLGKFSPEADLSNTQKMQWEQMQKEVVESYPEMGSHWHFLALREGYEKIYSRAPPRNLP